MAQSTHSKCIDTHLNNYLYTLKYFIIYVNAKLHVSNRSVVFKDGKVTYCKAIDCDMCKMHDQGVPNNEFNYESIIMPLSQHFISFMLYYQSVDIINYQNIHSLSQS